ncbi:MAG TPA: RHS repeat-associated core domain-containing protein [Pyrinomonadaceae bacterium]|nr:RHS repeat-associated core domain-containing protein [Pyrinomonadaceae bacterium]
MRQKFTLKERDNETGLDFFGERYYGSALGRFTTSDPLMASAKTGNPQTWNRYTYVLNNPLRYIDPVLCSTNGRWPFAAYTEGDSLDDFLDHAMLDLYDMLRERRAAIPKLPANCELTAVRFINAWTVLVEDSIFRLSTRPRQALFRLLGCLVAQG